MAQHTVSFALETMDADEELKGLLKDLSREISRCLASPENQAKLEKLQENKYELYLILESGDESMHKLTPGPILPLQLQPKPQRPPPRRVTRFTLSDDDKDFLRTLKIKVD